MLSDFSILIGNNYTIFLDFHYKYYNIIVSMIICILYFPSFVPIYTYIIRINRLPNCILYEYRYIQTHTRSRNV